MSLESKFQTYLDLIKTRQDANGFIESDTCDSLLFSSLIGCVQGVNVNIDAAWGRPLKGWWLRRPPACGTCVSEGFDRTFWQRVKDGLMATVPADASVSEATTAFAAEFGRGNSTISRDMLTGLAWYAWCNKRLDIAEAVVQRALANWGVVGRGDPSKINIMPGLLATYAWISHKLGGPSRPWLRWIPVDLGGHVTDYQAHLQVLHVLLRANVTGQPVSKYAKILNYQAKRERNNALFQYAAALANCWTPGTTSLLGDAQWWPDDRLPNENDRREQWLFQRDEGADWLPTMFWLPFPRVHSGGDFLFLYAMMSGRLK